MNRSTGPPSKEDPRRRSVGQKPNQWDDDELCRLIPQGEPPRKPDIRRLRAEHRALCQMLAPIEQIFWEIAQKRAQVADALARAGVEEFCEPSPRHKLITRKGGMPCR
jgi:hypothetical protein